MAEDVKLDRLHLSVFAAHAAAHMKLFGLSGWQAEFHLESSDDAMAWVRVQSEAHRVDFYLASAWSEEPTDERLAEKARHEVVHVLLSRLANGGVDRWATETELTAAEEELVVRLMALLPRTKKKREKKKKEKT